MVHKLLLIFVNKVVEIQLCPFIYVLAMAVFELQCATRVVTAPYNLENLKHLLFDFFTEKCSLTST